MTDSFLGMEEKDHWRYLGLYSTDCAPSGNTQIKTSGKDKKLAVELTADIHEDIVRRLLRNTNDFVFAGKLSEDELAIFYLLSVMVTFGTQAKAVQEETCLDARALKAEWHPQSELTGWTG